MFSSSTLPLELPDSHPDLCQIIAQQITASPQRRITFAEFMELALYHPQLGYYATNRDSQGIQQDFFTSAHLGVDFGELLAEQFVQMWEHLGYPRPFTLVEMGAGQGLLVQDIVRYLHRHHFECFAALEYYIVEKSTALIAAQQQRLQPLSQSWHSQFGQKLQWRTWEDIAPASIVGCCFSNELVDAFPVHLVIFEAGKLQEVYVTVADTLAEDSSSPITFQEATAEVSTPRLIDYFQNTGVQAFTEPDAPAYRTEINLAALDWLETLSRRLQRGYVLTIDYGYSAQRYYSPTRRQGTLQCYYQHRHHNHPYAAVGRQDITAHVNFTALEQQGNQCGLQTAGFTQQGLFLMALGLGDRISALSNPAPEATLQEILKRREVLHALIDPTGLGNFGVLIQSKGLDHATSLRGLETPPLFG